MNIPANALLGRTHDNEAIGYAVLTADRETFAPWTAATNTAPGWWAAVGLVSVPDDGAFVAWGREGQPAIAEDAIDPLPFSAADMMRQISTMLATVVDRVRELLPQPPPVIVETAHFDAGIDQVRAEVATDRQRSLDQLSAVAETLSALQEMTGSLSVLNDGANQVSILAEMQRKLSGVLGTPTPGLQAAVTEMSVTPLVTAIDALRDDVTKLEAKVSDGQRVSEMKQRAVAGIDRILSQLEGRT